MAAGRIGRCFPRSLKLLCRATHIDVLVLIYRFPVVKAERLRPRLLICEAAGVFNAAASPTLLPTRPPAARREGCRIAALLDLLQYAGEGREVIRFGNEASAVGQLVGRGSHFS